MKLSCFKISIITLLLSSVIALSAAPGFAEIFSITGFTKAKLDSVLGLSVTGQISIIRVQEGQAVKKGQPLLELELRSEQLDKERRQLLLESVAELDAVQSQLETMERHYQATKELFDATGSVTREELESQELELALARIELNRLEDTKKREKLEVEIAGNQLNKRILFAPFSGTVAEIKIAKGENCETDTELLRLVDTSKVEFIANVELPLSQQISTGQKVTLQFQSADEQIKQTAKISFISPVVDPASGLRKIKALFENNDGQIIPGMAGTLLLELED